MSWGSALAEARNYIQNAWWIVVFPGAALVLTILSLLYAFKSFDFIYIMTFGGPGTASTTLPFLSYRLAFEIYKFSDGAAVAVITLGLIILMALVYLRSVHREERA